MHSPPRDAPLINTSLRHSGARVLRAKPESRNRAPLLDSGSAPSKSAVADLDKDIAETRVQKGASRNDEPKVVRVLRAGCDKAAPVACLMLHLRSRYVSKAAILTVPVLLVLVENRSPA
jgi:hypothetical protein